MATYYEVLEVTPDASPEAIRASWQRLARQHHPDRGGDPEVFALVREAYDCLRDPVRRVAYDRADRFFVGAGDPARTEAQSFGELFVRNACAEIERRSGRPAEEVIADAVADGVRSLISRLRGE